MLSNQEISRLFSLYAELLLMHETDEELSKLLSGASYRLRNMDEAVIDLDKTELIKLFRPEIVSLIEQLKTKQTINALDELIQLTPQGLFEMMRIKGLGGKKLNALWKIAEIDSIDALLEACKKDSLKKIPGFGAKTQENIIAAIEAFRNNQVLFRYASVADAALSLQKELRRIFKISLVNICGEVRRQTNTVPAIEILIAVEQKKFSPAAIKKLLVIQSSFNPPA